MESSGDVARLLSAWAGGDEQPRKNLCQFTMNSAASPNTTGGAGGARRSQPQEDTLQPTL